MTYYVTSQSQEVVCQHHRLPDCLRYPPWEEICAVAAGTSTPVAVMQSRRSADPDFSAVQQQLQQLVRRCSCLSAKHRCQMPVKLQVPLQLAGFALLAAAELQELGIIASAVAGGSLSVSGTEAVMGRQAVLDMLPVFGTVTAVSLVAQKTDAAVTR